MALWAPACDLEPDDEDLESFRDMPALDSFALSDAMACVATNDHACAELEPGVISCWHKSPEQQLSDGEDVVGGDDESPTTIDRGAMDLTDEPKKMPGEVVNVILVKDYD
ncbi:hypothetical protein [Paraliomyxa miuraensis]|uniref:hypothetical protein n=1 Tax=Paraliomyxa miuraensis TaxID=376150 RepID=UPI00224D0E04|nr:hypothetical protein [Paraliomyxa miuraensis]MCX4239424.1 hypothetical protein [Paraliomyxa miuraensis]